jgi:HAMP domain-containing protein
MAWPRRGSLFWTLSASLLAVLVFAVVLQWLVAVLLVEPGLRRWQETRNFLVAERLAAAVGKALADQAPDRVPGLVADHQREIEPARLFVHTASGRWIGAPVSQGQGPGTPGPTFAGGWARRLDAARAAYERSQGLDLEEEDRPPLARRRGREGPDPRFDFVFFASASVPATAGPGATVYVTAPRARLRVFTLLPRHAALYVPVAVLVAACAGLLISHRLQRRIARLDELATRIGRGELDARIDRPGSDELGHLGARLNAMAAGLESAREEVRALERQRSQLLADISHDLVTPLTTIRGSPRRCSTKPFRPRPKTGAGT